MLSAITALLSGGLTGIIGAGLQKYSDYKTKKLELQINQQRYVHEVELRKIDIELMKSEWGGRFKVAEVEGDTAAFKESLTSEPKRFSEGVKYTTRQGWMMVLLDVLRGIVRPGLTVYLCAITTIIYYQAIQILGGYTITSAAAFEMVDKIIATVLYLTTTVVCWWFGARNKGEAPK
jgi:hypothetical protein